MKHGFLLILPFILIACAIPPIDITINIEIGKTSEPTEAVSSPIGDNMLPTTLSPTKTTTIHPTLTPVRLPTYPVNAAPTPLIPEVAAIDCLPQNTRREAGVVVRVIDGDTIEVDIAGGKYRLRYIGVDSPEPDQIFGEESAQRNRELVDQMQVTLIKDVSETDRYGRLLRYVLTEQAFVNYEMVRTGYASASTYPPDVACNETFLEAQRKAVAMGLGFWFFPTPQESSQQPTISADTIESENCHPSYPTVCIPPPPPDLDCKDIPYRRFQVLPPDPHRFDGDQNGIGCEK